MFNTCCWATTGRRMLDPTKKRYPMNCSRPGFPVFYYLLRVCSNSCPLSWWCLPTISSSVVPFSSCLQSSPASGSFQMSQFFASGGQSIGASASASVIPMNIQDWFPLGWTGWISLQSKGLSRVFYNTTVQKHHSKIFSIVHKYILYTFQFLLHYISLNFTSKFTY